MKSPQVLAIFILVFSINANALTQAYFSPKGGCEENVIQMIKESHSTLDIAMYSLNNENILKIIEDANKRGVKIRILLDRVQASVNRKKTLKLKADSLNVKIHSHNKIQHNKFAIADKKKIVTGSFNWTNPAESKNEENCILTDEENVVKSYEKRFDQNLWVVNPQDKSDRAFAKLEAKEKESRIPASLKKLDNK